MKTERLYPELIKVGERLRPLDPAKVDALAKSFLEIGQQSPIHVWLEDNDTVHLIAGRHRLAAAIAIDLPEVECIIVEWDEIQRRLWEIAENLHRSELTVTERAEHVAEWVRLTEEKNKLAQLGPVSGGRGNEGGVRAAARDLGLERKVVDRAVKIASITPEAKAAAVEAGIDDNQSALLEVADQPADEQVEYVRKLESHDRAAKRQEAKELREQAAEEFAEWLSDKASYSEHAMLISWLEAIKSKVTIDAFRRLNGAVFDKTRSAC